MDGLRQALRAQHGTVRGLFHAMDTNGDGVLDAAEVAHAVGEEAAATAVQELCGARPESGHVAYADLYNVLKVTPSASGGRRKGKCSGAAASGADKSEEARASSRSSLRANAECTTKQKSLKEVRAAWAPVPWFPPPGGSMEQFTSRALQP